MEDKCFGKKVSYQLLQPINWHWHHMRLPTFFGAGLLGLDLGAPRPMPFCFLTPPENKRKVSKFS